MCREEKIISGLLFVSFLLVRRDLIGIGTEMERFSRSPHDDDDAAMMPASQFHPRPPTRPCLRLEGKICGQNISR